MMIHPAPPVVMPSIVAICKVSSLRSTTTNAPSERQFLLDANSRTRMPGALALTREPARLHRHANATPGVRPLEIARGMDAFSNSNAFVPIHPFGLVTHHARDSRHRNLVANATRTGNRALSRLEKDESKRPVRQGIPAAPSQSLHFVPSPGTVCQLTA